MPIAPPKPCRHPGCAEYGTQGGFCAQHRAAQWRAVDERASNNPALAMARRIRSSAQWKRANAVFAARHPLCCDPFGIHGQHNPTLGTQTHHVEPLSKRPDLAFVESNLRRLCDYCHTRVEFMERNGKDTHALFNQQAQASNLDAPAIASEAPQFLA